jgi:FkbM family methyltransferase
MTDSMPRSVDGHRSHAHWTHRKSVLGAYRAIARRFPGLHLLLYRLGEGYVLPMLEWLSGFRTLPDDPMWFRSQLVFGTYERETAAVIRKLVRHGHIALDLGAHVGFYTRLLGRRVGDRGRVIAFEPHPVHFDLLAANVQHLDNVQLVRKAASSSVGIATLFDALPDTGGSSLAPREHNAGPLQQRFLAPRIRTEFVPRRYEVQTVTVDQVLSEAGVDHVDFVKIDVEGAEPAALRGMAVTISRSIPMAMVIELNPSTLKLFQCTPQGLLECVREYDFDIYTIGEGVKPLTTDVQEQVIHELRNGHINLLCMRGYEPSVLW